MSHATTVIIARYTQADADEFNATPEHQRGPWQPVVENKADAKFQAIEEANRSKADWECITRVTLKEETDAGWAFEVKISA